MVEAASMRAGIFTGSFIFCEPLTKSAFRSIRQDQLRLGPDSTSHRLCQFNGGCYIMLFPQFETDVFPMRGPAELLTAFEHEVGVIVSFT